MDSQNDNGLRTCDGCKQQFKENQLEFVESHSDKAMCSECRENYVKCWDCMEWKDRREVTFYVECDEWFCEDCHDETLL